MPFSTGLRPPSNQVQAMTVQKLQKLLEDGDSPLEMQFVDVREEGEAHVARLPHFQLYPMSRMSVWMEESALEDEFDFDRPTICLCHHGMRSEKVSSLPRRRMLCKFVSRFTVNEKRISRFVCLDSQVAALLANRGFTNVYNVVGGIDAYSRLVDPNVPLY